MGGLGEFVSATSIWLPMAGFLLILAVETVVPMKHSRLPALLAALTLAVALVRLALTPLQDELCGGTIAGDALARTLEAFLLLVGLAVIALGEPMLEHFSLGRAEFHGLLLASLSGMLLTVAARDLLLFFLGIELLSIPLYVLAAYRRLRIAAIESGFKYFLLGAFASGFLIYGIALLYGAAGATLYRHLGALAADLPRQGVLYHLGLACLMVGVGFKAAAAPFHAWAPDVYHGASTPITAFMAAGVKTAAFGGALRLALEVLPSAPAVVTGLAAIACMSMVVGNLGALLQTNLKRLIAWSSIGHAGYLLVGVTAAAAADEGARDAARSAVLFYLGTYGLTTLGAFAILALFLGAAGEGQELRTLRGLARTRPWLAAALALCFLSLAGIPPTAGFLGKLYVIRAAWTAGQLVPALFLAGTSVLALGYYLRVIATMYMERDEGAPLPLLPSLGTATVTLTCSGALLLFGLWPQPLLRMIAP